MFVRLIFFGALGALLFVSSPPRLHAQPGEDPVSHLKGKLLGLAEQIKDKTRAIDKTPGRAELYAARGALYNELYREMRGVDLAKLFGRYPFPYFLRNTAPKALADFDRALALAPQRPDFYAGRAETRALRWHYEVARLYWPRELERLEPPEWREWAPNKKSNEVKIFERVLRHPDFAVALDDLERALRLSADALLTRKIHDLAARLYLSRAQQLAGKLEYNLRLAVKPNEYDYSAFDDLEAGIAHLAASHPAADLGPIAPVPYSWFDERRPTLRSALYYKALLADRSGLTATALAALDEAERFVDPQNRDDFFVCHFYVFRSRLHAKNGDYEAAVADAAAPTDSLDRCRGAAAARGDAFFAKADWAGAVADYTKQLESSDQGLNVGEVRYRRGLARLKLGDRRAALEDFTLVIRQGEPKAAAFRQRAALYREFGELEKAGEDEEKGRQMTAIEARRTNVGAVYGKLTMPDGRPVDDERARVYLVLENGTKEPWAPWPESGGRFRFWHVAPQTVRLYATFETVERGATVRYYAETNPFRVGEGVEGPFVLRLARDGRRRAAPQ